MLRGPFSIEIPTFCLYLWQKVIKKLTFSYSYPHFLWHFASIIVSLRPLFLDETIFTPQKDMEEKEYLDKYEQNLIVELLKVCTQQGKLEGQLLPSPDLDDKWEEVAQPYMGDAIKEIAKYPTVALGWMMYLGMAIAHYWDIDWELYGKIPNLYEYIRVKRGFDCMDEYVRETVLGFSPKAKPADGQAMNEYDAMEELVRMLSTICLTQIRREQIEPQSPMAFRVYLRSIHALYLVGASLELYRLGYKMTA